MLMAQSRWSHLVCVTHAGATMTRRQETSNSKNTDDGPEVNLLAYLRHSLTCLPSTAALLSTDHGQRPGSLRLASRLGQWSECVHTHVSVCVHIRVQARGCAPSPAQGGSAEQPVCAGPVLTALQQPCSECVSAGTCPRPCPQPHSACGAPRPRLCTVLLWSLCLLPAQVLMETTETPMSCTQMMLGPPPPILAMSRSPLP